jgi:hypothetical protein
MAWMIDHDYIDHGDNSAVGTGQGELDGETFTFRLLDDDGEVYYHGVADASAAEDDELDGGLYIALKWGEGYAGCTDLQVRGRTGLDHGLTTQRYLDIIGASTTSWVSIYG